MESNKIYNIKWEDAAFQLPEKSVNLLILDPPYFEVKGDFDFIWPDFESYQKDVEKWAIACKYVLAGSGTECAMAAKEQRRFIGFDINADYCKMATNRVRPYLENHQTNLF